MTSYRLRYQEHGGLVYCDHIIPLLFRELSKRMTALDTGDYGAILRAKGIVPSGGKWLHFDYVPEEQDVRYGSADYTGRLCVIGAQLKEDKLKELFSL